MEDESTDKQHKNRFDWLKAYQWQKGQSGNPAGRPKGKSMKEFIRDFLSSLPDEEKLMYLQNLTPEMLNAWKMGEGNPDNKIQGDSDNPITLVLKDINGNSLAEKLRAEELSDSISPSSTEV